MENVRTPSSLARDAYAVGIGRTPILPLQTEDGTIYAKLEWFNRFRSVKDRAAYFMIRGAELEHKLTTKKTLVEASSGNTGIALANIARLLGYSAEIFVPASSSPETLSRLRSSGARIVEIEDEFSRAGRVNIDASIRALNRRISEDAERFLNLDQYSNEANTMGHVYTTGPEISSTLEKFTLVLVGIGTGGTVTGLATHFKKHLPDVKIVAAEPEPGHHIQGLKNLAVSEAPEIIKRNLGKIDRWISVSDDDAVRGVREILDKTGILVGLSSGSNYIAARKILAENRSESIVTVFPDSGEKYREKYESIGIVKEREFDSIIDFTLKVPDSTLPCKFNGS